MEDGFTNEAAFSSLNRSVKLAIDRPSRQGGSSYVGRTEGAETIG